MEQRRGSWEYQRGFSIIELTIIIVIMGIILAVASSSWFGAVESRRVDSATNEMVSELRRAHTSATNRLANYEVRLVANSPTYQMVDPASGSETRTLTGMEGADNPPVIDTTVTIVFKADGSATAAPAPPVGSPITFGIQAPDDDPCHTIEINTVTSRVEILPNAC